MTKGKVTSVYAIKENGEPHTFLNSSPWKISILQ